VDDLLNLCDQEELAASSNQGAGGVVDQAVPAPGPVQYTLIETDSSEASPEAQDVPVSTVEEEVEEAPFEQRVGAGTPPGSDGACPSGAEVVVLDDAVSDGEVVPVASNVDVVGAGAVTSADIPAEGRVPVLSSPVRAQFELSIVPFPGANPDGRLFLVSPGEAPESLSASGWGALALGGRLIPGSRVLPPALAASRRTRSWDAPRWLPRAA